MVFKNSDLMPSFPPEGMSPLGVPMGRPAPNTNFRKKKQNAPFIKIHQLMFKEPDFVNGVYVMSEFSKFDSVPTRFEMNHAETAFTCYSKNEVGLANLPQKFDTSVNESKL